MSKYHVRQHLKNMMLPIAMVAGAVFYPWMHYVTFLSPYLIFLMLVITYCRLRPRDLRPTGYEWVMLVAQIALSAATYFVILPFDEMVASGVMICVFVPTATAAPVITSMLGGSIVRVATYSLICNLFVALAGPAVLAAVGAHPEMSFLKSFAIICEKVVPLLILPMVTAFLLDKVSPKLHDRLATHQDISFYTWAVSLFIVVGSSVSFVINHYTPSSVLPMVCLALGAMVVCVGQFVVGRRIGRRFGEEITGGQTLGQKNTVLAVWLALAYLNPIASVAPASYVAWQNILNSWQLVRHRRMNSRIANDLS